MSSNGLHGITYQNTQKVEVGNKPSHTNETLISYILLAVR
jgi:hypothetical protein